jgi:hypothetical protein
MARWMLSVLLGLLLCLIALPGCSKENQPKLDTSQGGGPGFNAPIKGGKPGERPSRTIGG